MATDVDPGRGRRSVCTEPPHHRRRCFPNDLDVPPEGPAGHIEVIEPTEVVDAKVVSAGDLPQTGDAWSKIESPGFPPHEGFGFALSERAGSDQRHLAEQDVENLWNLVDP